MQELLIHFIKSTIGALGFRTGSDFYDLCKEVFLKIRWQIKFLRGDFDKKPKKGGDGNEEKGGENGRI